MRNRRPRVSAPAQQPLAKRLARSQWTLPLVGLLVLAAILGGVFAWPTGEGEVSKAADDAPLVLPTLPEPLAVEAMRAEAEEVVSRLLERFPEATEAYHAAAMLYQFLNQHEQAVGFWQKSIELNPQDAAAYEWLAKMQARKGQDEAAVRTLEVAIQKDLAGPEIYHEYAAVLQKTGKLSDAAKIARQALARHPESRDLWIVLGQTQVQLGQLAEARDSFEAALRVDPKSVAAHFGAANACQRLGDQAEADFHRREMDEVRAAGLREELPFEQEYNNSLRSTVAIVLSAGGTCYDKHGEAAEAERLCLRACAIDPTNPNPYRQLANMYHRDGRLPRALVVQQRLLEVEPENPGNAINFASLSFQLGRMKDGEDALLVAAETFPRNGLVLEALALVYMRSGDPRRARPFAERAVRAQPTRERYHLLSSICKSLGDEAAASEAERGADQLTLGADVNNANQ